MRLSNSYSADHSATLSQSLTSHTCPAEYMLERIAVCNVMPRKIASISDAAKSWTTGSPVPRNGVYKVSHSDHVLPNEVTLLAGQMFPRCAACATPVTFSLKRSLSEQSVSAGFHVELYELPVQERLRDAG
jgi:hypothetical protein